MLILLEGFSTLPRGYWKDTLNQRYFFDSLATKLHIKEQSDWYSIETKDVMSHGAKPILAHYNQSLVKALMSVYPDYNWLPWKFRITHQNFWKGTTILHLKLKYIKI